MNAAISVKRFSSPVGELILGVSPAGLNLLEFADRSDARGALRRRRCNLRVSAGDQARFARIEAELAAYFAGSKRPNGAPDMEFDLHGTDFQVAVWNALLGIPSGETRSYAEIARAVGKPGAYRAVGNAVGSNPVSIFVPCHRVIRSGGGMGGYGGGLWRKEFLLELESR